MKRALLMLLGAVVVIVGAVIVWFYSSTNIDDPVEVTAPPVDATDTIAEATATTEPGPGDSTDGTVYALGEESTVSFEIEEVLRGEPMTVVATNTEVAAEIALDITDLANTRIGTVVIGAQTFETDSSNRDRAIRGPILDSNTFQTIQFVPTSIEGLEGSASVGDELRFTVTGDLTIRDVTNEVTFDLSATLADEDTIEGSGEATLSREAFELQIPSVPSVADVSDEVVSRIDFVAEAVS